MRVNSMANGFHIAQSAVNPNTKYIGANINFGSSGSIGSALFWKESRK